jgi:hypothetical protein
VYLKSRHRLNTFFFFDSMYINNIFLYLPTYMRMCLNRILNSFAPSEMPYSADYGTPKLPTYRFFRMGFQRDFQWFQNHHIFHRERMYKIKISNMFQSKKRNLCPAIKWPDTNGGEALVSLLTRFL